MQFTEHREGLIVVIAVEGRRDHAGAGTFQDYTVKRILEGVRSMVIDFTGTVFVASMGIRAIIVRAQEMMRAGGRFGITGLSPDLWRLFEISGLLKVFNTYPTLADAVADGVWV